MSNVETLHQAPDLMSEEPLKAGDLDFYTLLRRQASEGRLFFNQRRAVIFDVEALGTLRQQLLESLGEKLAMGVLTRFGYAHGYNDAKMLGENFDWETETDWLAAGPSMHTLEGIVHVTPQKIEFDRETGHFHMHGIWLNSYEAEEHLKRYGPGDQPVCWTLTGYASGYTSSFFGRDLLAIETECVGKGDARCYWEIRPVDEWGPEAEPYLKALEQIDISGQLFEINQQLQEQTRQQTLLSEMAAELNLTTSVDEIFKIAAVKTRQIINTDRVSITLLNSGGDTFRVFALDDKTGAIPQGTELPVDETTGLGQAIRTGQVIIRHDIQTSGASENRQLAQYDFHSTMVAPLVTGGRIIGTLNVGSKMPEAYGEHSKNMMLRIASFLGTAIENQRLFDQAQKRAAELEETTAFLDSVFENIPSMVFVKDARDLRFVRFNKAGAELIGVDPEYMIGKNDYDFFGKEEANFFTAKDRQVLSGGELVDVPEEPLHTIDGDIRFLHTRKVPILGADGEPKYLLGISEDITERKQRESELRKLSRAVEQSSSTVVITNIDGYIEYVNPRFSETTGYTVEEAIGQHTRILKSGETPDEEYKQLWTTIAAGGEWHGEFHNKRKNGELYWEFASISPIRNEAGVITHFLAVKEDITERKQAEGALQESEERYRSLYAKTPVMLHSIDAQGRIVDVSDYWLEVLGYERDEVIGRQSVDFLTEESRHYAQTVTLPNLIKTGSSRDVSYQFIKKNGQIIDVLLSATAEYDDKGEFARSLAVLTDVTGRKQAEKTLVEERRLLRTLIDNMPDYIYVKDAESRFLIANNEVARVMGAAMPDELIGKTDFDFYPKELAVQYYANEQALIQSGQAVINQEEPYLNQLTNEAGWILTTKAPFRDASGKIAGFVGMGRDITKLKQTEATLARRAAELETVAELGTIASTVLETKELLQTVVDLTNERFGLYHTHIYLLDGTDNTLNLTAGTGEVGRKLVAEGWSIPLEREQSLVARAARTGQGVIVNDVREEPGYLLLPLLPDTRSEMTVPLIVGDRVLGVLDVQSDKVNRFTSEDVSIYTTLAAQVAVAMENARLFEESRKSAIETENLYEASRRITSAGDLQQLVAAVMEAIPISVINRAVLQIYEYDSMGEMEAAYVAANWYSGHGSPPTPPGARYPRRQFATIELFFNPKPVFFDDTLHDERIDPTTNKLLQGLNVQAMATIPLWAGSRQLGTLLLQADQPYQFTEYEMRPYVSLAGQVAVAVENRRLLEQVQQRITERTALNEVSLVILTQTNPLSVYQVATQALVDDFNMSFARLWILDEIRNELVLQASAGEYTHLDGPHSRVSLNSNRKLAWIANRREPHITNDLLNDSRLDNKEWARETNTIAFAGYPFFTGDEMLGILGMFSHEPIAEETLPLLQSLSVLIGTVVNTRRLFEQAQVALAEVEATQRRYTVQAWETYRTKDVTLSHEHVRAGVKPLGQTLPPEVSQAVAQKRLLTTGNRSASGNQLRLVTGDQSPAADGQPDETKSSLIAPLTVRGEVIGVLGLQETDERDWFPEEVALVEAIAEQMAQAAENIRLIDETQQRAAREKRVNEIGEKIRTAQSLEEALKIAVKEVGLSLKAPQTTVHLGLQSKEGV